MVIILCTVFLSLFFNQSGVCQSNSYEKDGILKVYVPECPCTPTTTIILLYVKSDSIYGIQYDGGDSDEECKICWEPNGCFIGKRTMEGKVIGLYYSFDSKDTPVKFTMKLGDGTCVEQKDYDVNNKSRTSKEFVFTENKDNDGFVQKDFGLFTSSINLRESASVKAKILTKLQNDTKINVLGIFKYEKIGELNGIWMKVKAGNVVGWIFNFGVLSNWSSAAFENMD